MIEGSLCVESGSEKTQWREERVPDLDRCSFQYDYVSVNQRARRSNSERDLLGADVSGDVASGSFKSQSKRFDNPPHRNEQVLVIELRRRVDGEPRPVQDKRDGANHFAGLRVLGCMRGRDERAEDEN